MLLCFFNADCGQVIACLLMIFYFHFVFGTSGNSFKYFNRYFNKEDLFCDYDLGNLSYCNKIIIKLMVSLFIIKLSPQENIFKSSLLCINCKHKNLNMKLNGEINCDVSRWFRFKVFPNDTLNSISIYVKFSQSLFLTGMASCKRYAPSMSDKKKLPHIFPKKSTPQYLFP